ncbi:MAG: PAS domain S-box protein [Candidatus Obscuribacterales bacterium]|nr:PAS domain S-box protein [Candidatus Obscuribacterales bacterium]
MFLKDHFDDSRQLTLMFQAVEAARNGVVITDPNRADNPIIYTNPAFTEITGYQAEEILGRNCRFLQADDRNQPALNEIRLALEQARPVSAVLRNYRKDGKRFFNELTISPVRDSENRLVAFVGIQHDITRRVEAEERISDFYSVVSHELRTPIAKIKSSLSVIADGEAGPINESVKRFISISANAADSLWRLIENILDFKKLESGKFRFLCQRLSLAQLVDSTVAEFQPVAETASITICCQCQVNPTVNADGQRIVQVLENLLSNAVKFSEPGAQVDVRLTSHDKWARVEVTDFGPGIADSDINKLFDKFQQLESPDSRSRGGTGLGLAVCKAIVEAHGGKVGVFSRLGEGSTFWFELEQLT